MNVKPFAEFLGGSETDVLNGYVKDAIDILEGRVNENEYWAEHDKTDAAPLTVADAEEIAEHVAEAFATDLARFLIGVFEIKEPDLIGPDGLPAAWTSDEKAAFGAAFLRANAG